MPHENEKSSESGKSREKKTQAEIAEECFEFYYEMGTERSLLKLAKHTKIKFEILKNWEEAFGWVEKITQRNAEVERQFDALYTAKSKDIRNRLTRQMEVLLDDVENCSMGLPFQIRGVDDMKQLAQAYESLVRANNMALNTSRMDLQGKDGNVTTWAELMASSGEHDRVKLNHD